MTLRISSISIKRDGPLKSDFILHPCGLNVIYGHNETGKTYVLEAMISMLFKTGAGTPWVSRATKTRSSTMRKWDPRGEIRLSGLGEEEAVFSPGGRKLEDFAEDTEGLPMELSRLMVVRSGDTRLSDARDGVGDEVLRTYLSGNRVLDEVEENIPQETVKNAVISKGIIDTDKKGLFKDMLALEGQLEYLDGLRTLVDETASLTTIIEMEKERDRLLERIAELEDARRYRAFLMDGEIQKREIELEELPSDSDLIKLGTDVSLYWARKRERDEIRDKLRDLSPSLEDLRWLERARDQYMTDSDGRKGSGGFLLPAILASFMLLTVAGAFFSRLLSAMAGAGALVCLLLMIRRAAGNTQDERILRLKELREEFRKRFHRELSDIATLNMVRDELESVQTRHDNLRESAEKLELELRDSREKIDSTMYLYAGDQVPEEKWDETMDGIRSSRRELLDRISEMRSQLSSLNVQPDSYLARSPGTEWDQKEFLDLRDRLTAVKQELETERKNLEKLKFDIASAVNTNSRDIRELIEALENRRGEVAASHAEAVAEILAGNCVYRAVSQYRNQENSRLEDALGSPEVINPLYGLTGRYNGLRLNEKGEINLRMKEGGEYPLFRLSSGAAEQVYMALRTGFARLTLGSPAFLLLDDAFQHSDWIRRKNLVAHILEMVKGGWQIFYFTMDDHIKKLFSGLGRELGETLYQQVNLD